MTEPIEHPGDSHLLRLVSVVYASVLIVGLLCLFLMTLGMIFDWWAMADLTMSRLTLAGAVGVSGASIGLLITMLTRDTRLPRLMHALNLLIPLLMAGWFAYGWVSIQLREDLERPLDALSTATGLWIAAAIAVATIGARVESSILGVLRIIAALVASTFCLALIALYWLWRPEWESVVEIIITGTVVWGLAGFGGLVLVAQMIRRERRPKSVGVDASIPERSPLRFLCPKCRAEQAMPNGVHRCTSCGTVLLIDVEEPRCSCGYLLYRLASDTCPECGQNVPAENRWPSMDKPAAKGGSHP